MLLEFRASNYKSFKEEFVFSMVPAPKQTGLDYSVQKTKVKNKEYKSLSSAVVYGPNAAGKTNIIGAMDTMRAIVLRGNIKNAESVTTPNFAAHKLEVIPFYTTNNLPVSLSISFIEDSTLISYSIKMLLGEFLGEASNRRILEETLKVNEVVVFKRQDQLYVEKSALPNEMWNEGVAEQFDAAIGLTENGLNEEELFLTNGFKNIFSKQLVSMILNWFNEKFIVIYRSDSIQTLRKFVDPQEDTIYIEKTLTEAAKLFGVTANVLGYKASSNENEDAILYSILKKGGKTAAIPSNLFESYGTMRFINEFPLIIRALLTGATLIMDEFDASIHPLALINIINVFHNDDINKNKAQLIFNTHNPIFLNSSIFRRDEIKFVERDDETHESSHYALSDFKTSGENSTRKGEDYMTNYFVDKYGAIKDVDFSEIFDSLVNGEVTSNE